MSAELERAGDSAARRLDKRIRLLAGTINDNFTKLCGLVEEAKRTEIHRPLGFSSWTAYVADAFQIQARLDRGQRQELVGYLSGEGMSQRAIAGVVGVSKNTVTSDLREVSQSGTPEVLDADVVDQQEISVIGLDGKTYNPKPPAQVESSLPEHKPRRRSISSEFADISLKLYTLDRRIRKLIADDRVSRNRAALVGNRNDLIRFRDLLDEAINKMSLPASRDAE